MQGGITQNSMWQTVKQWQSNASSNSNANANLKLSFALTESLYSALSQKYNGYPLYHK